MINYFLISKIYFQSLRIARKEKHQQQLPPMPQIALSTMAASHSPTNILANYQLI
jgi:hypothetical protein